MENSKISWTHHTFNPWIGCMKVGPGCDHCYAEAQDIRWAQGVHWGAGAPRKRTTEANWRTPLKWDREAAAAGERRRVFCGSLCDILDNEVDDDWRRDLWALPAQTPHLDWLFLTKRIGNAGKLMPVDWTVFPPSNVWWGATMVTQEEWDRDIPKLLEVPAAVRFVSMEPLLGPIDMRAQFWLGQGSAIHCPNCESGSVAPWGGGDGGASCPVCGGDAWLPGKLDWVIVGGESGAGARPMHSDWARSLRDQCQRAGVSFHFKQWGMWRRGSDFRPGARIMLRDGRLLDDSLEAMQAADREGEVFGSEMIRWSTKEAAGRDLDGRTWDEVPR